MNDFDFFLGRWRVHNRRLRERFADCSEWDEFDGHTWVETWIDGVMQIERMELPTLGVTSSTIRTFDASRNEWSLRWLVSSEGVLYPPVMGQFNGDTGIFRGPDTEGGVPVETEFLWDKSDPELIIWEQRMSRDGVTWEHNWTMEFTREEAPST